jgi:hypothetical protein
MENLEKDRKINVVKSMMINSLSHSRSKEYGILQQVLIK